MIGLFFTGAYILKAIGKVLHGALPDRWKDAPLEIGVRERLAVAPLMILLLVDRRVAGLDFGHDRDGDSMTVLTPSPR